MDPSKGKILDGDTELADKITLLASHINAGTYRFLKLLGEFDRRSGWKNNRGQSPIIFLVKLEVQY